MRIDPIDYSKTKIYNCSSCRTVFERFWDSKKVLHYYSLPTYGLKQKICPLCNGDETKNITIRGLDERDANIPKIY